MLIFIVSVQLCGLLLPGPGRLWTEPHGAARGPWSVWPAWLCLYWACASFFIISQEFHFTHTLVAAHVTAVFPCFFTCILSHLETTWCSQEDAVGSVQTHRSDICGESQNDCHGHQGGVLPLCPRHLCIIVLLSPSSRGRPSPHPLSPAQRSPRLGPRGAMAFLPGILLEGDLPWGGQWQDDQCGEQG